MGRGTSPEKLYTKLGWESISSQRWGRRLTLLYKFINNLSPVYTKDPIPPLNQSQYSLRGQDVIERLRARTEECKSLSELNKLESELRLAPFVAIFKKKFLSIIRRPPPLQNLSLKFTTQQDYLFLRSLELVTAS